MKGVLHNLFLIKYFFRSTFKPPHLLVAELAFLWEPWGAGEKNYLKISTSKKLSLKFVFCSFSMFFFWVFRKFFFGVGRRRLRRPCLSCHCYLPAQFCNITTSLVCYQYHFLTFLILSVLRSQFPLLLPSSQFTFDFVFCFNQLAWRWSISPSIFSSY